MARGRAHVRCANVRVRGWVGNAVMCACGSADVRVRACGMVICVVVCVVCGRVIRRCGWRRCGRLGGRASERAGAIAGVRVC